MLRPGDIVYCASMESNRARDSRMLRASLHPAWQKGGCDRATEKNAKNEQPGRIETLPRRILVRYAEDVRETYLNIRDSLYAPPPTLQHGWGPARISHAELFHIESAEAASLRPWPPLALTRTVEDLLEEAEFDHAGKAQSCDFRWLKKGNRKISTWDHTIMGSIRISANSLTGEVNSAKRAARIRAEIEKRLGRRGNSPKYACPDSRGSARNTPRTNERENGSGFGT